MLQAYERGAWRYLCRVIFEEGRSNQQPPWYPKLSATGQQYYSIYSDLFGLVKVVGLPFRVVLEHEICSNLPS